LPCFEGILQLDQQPSLISFKKTSSRSDLKQISSRLAVKQLGHLSNGNNKISNLNVDAERPFLAA
jgi:hypothetical protein